MEVISSHGSLAVIGFIILITFTGSAYGVSVRASVAEYIKYEGEPAVLHCEFLTNSTYTPKITWYSVNRRLIHIITQFGNSSFTSDKYKGRVEVTSRGSLKIANVTDQDVGNYTCQVEVFLDSPESGNTMINLLVLGNDNNSFGIKTRAIISLAVSCIAVLLPIVLVIAAKMCLLVEFSGYVRVFGYVLATLSFVLAVAAVIMLAIYCIQRKWLVIFYDPFMPPIDRSDNTLIVGSVLMGVSLAFLLTAAIILCLPKHRRIGTKDTKKNGTPMMILRATQGQPDKEKDGTYIFV